MRLLLLILFIKTAAIVLLRAEMILLFVRAILSWIPIGDRIYDVVQAMTEPVLMPVRMVVDRLMPQSELPIDISFIVTYLLLYIAELALSVF